MLGDARKVLANRSRRAVFLCYHSVADTGPPFLSVPVERFDRQLALLRRVGLHNGTLDDLVALSEGRRLDAPRVFLTFDDGFRDNLAYAMPVMQAHGYLPFVFVLPDLLEHGGPLAWAEVAERRARHPDVMRSMTWSHVERMAALGAEIGSHTCAHSWLTRLGPEALHEDLAASRRRIAERLGRCDTLAYPFGDWNREVADAAAKVGYRFAFTMPRDAQRTADALSIPRIAVDHRDDELRLRTKITRLGRGAALSSVRPLVRRLAR